MNCLLNNLVSMQGDIWDELQKDRKKKKREGKEKESKQG